MPHSLHSSTQAPTFPCLPPHFSFPVLTNLIHLPLSKAHSLLPSFSHIETKTHRPRNRLTRSWKTRTHTRTPAALVEGGTQEGVCLCTHLNIHTHSHRLPTQGCRNTRRVKQGRTQLWTQGDTASPAHPPLPPGGRKASSQFRLPPFFPANVSLLGLPGLWGKGLRNAAGATWGKVGTDCSLPGPAGLFPNREAICGESLVAGEPPVTSPRVPSPRHLPAALRRPPLQCRCPTPRSRACWRASPLICAVWTARVGKAGFSVPAESTGRPRAAGLFLSYQCRNAAAAAAAAAWAVGRQGSPEGAPSLLRSSRSVREPSRTQRGELEEKKKAEKGKKEEERERE